MSRKTGVPSASITDFDEWVLAWHSSPEVPAEMSDFLELKPLPDSLKCDD